MHIIGRIDKADFPELNLREIDVKVDTGAYTSSIHCHEVKEVELNGVKHIEFKLLDPSHPEYEERVFKVKNYKAKAIKAPLEVWSKGSLLKPTLSFLITNIL